MPIKCKEQDSKPLPIDLNITIQHFWISGLLLARNVFHISLTPGSHQKFSTIAMLFWKYGETRVFASGILPSSALDACPAYGCTA